MSNEVSKGTLIARQIYPNWCNPTQDAACRDAARLIDAALQEQAATIEEWRQLHLQDVAELAGHRATIERLEKDLELARRLLCETEDRLGQFIKGETDLVTSLRAQLAEKEEAK